MKELLIFISSILLLACTPRDIETSHAYIFLEGGRIKFDSVEYISLEDKVRMDELGLDEDDMPNGYYLYDEIEKSEYLRLEDKTKYMFYDTENIFVGEDDDKKYETDDMDKFRKYLESKEGYRPLTFKIDRQGNKIVYIEEVFMN